MMIFDDLIDSEDIALISEDSTQYSYADVIRIASKMVSDIQARSLVFLMCNNTAETVLAYIGLLRKKIVIVLLDPEIKLTQYEALIQLYKPNYTISSKPLEFCDLFRNDHNFYIYSNFSNYKHKLHNDLAMMLTTSGTTGSSKYVRLSYDNIYHNTKDIVAYLGVSSRDTTITTLPMQYTYGLSIINTHLFKRARIVFFNASVISKDFRELLQQYQVTSFGGVPYMYELLSKQKFLDKSVPSLRYITQAGDKLSKGIKEKILDSCAKNGIDFITMYGLTEATARVSYLPWEYARKKIGSIGVAIPNGAIELVDKSDMIITNSYVSGEIVYTGENVMMGYADSLEDLEKGDVMKGKLYTGDIAYCDEDGFYFMVGRKKRIVKLFGNRVNLDEIEKILHQNDFFCVCTEGENSINIFTTEKGNEDRIKTCLHDTANINMKNINVHYINEIPKNASGKIAYRLL